MMRPTLPLLTLALLSTLVACHERRPADPAAVSSGTPSPAPTAAPTPLPPPRLDAGGLDIGPTDAWYARNAGRIQLDVNASAEDLNLAMSLIDWVTRGDLQAWAKAAPRIEAAFAARGQLRLPFLPVNGEEARKYHSAAAPLGQRPEKERDPQLEDAYYRKALLLNPNDADLWNHLAIGASVAKDYAAAERYAKTAIVVDPTFLSAYQELAYAYKNSERYAEAVAVAERGLALDGDIHTKAVLLARQGQAYWMLSEREKAVSAFATSKRLGGPSWVDSYLDGRQELGKSWKVEAGGAGSPSPSPTPR